MIEVFLYFFILQTSFEIMVSDMSQSPSSKSLTFYSPIHHCTRSALGTNNH